MKFETRKLVTIICEAQLENDLVDALHDQKIKGYTICEARGEGHRGVRSGDWEQNRNIQIEIVCDDKDAERIMSYLKEEYYENYAMISFMTDVQVIRGEKFT